MSRVILICGKIACGKSVYAARLKREMNAVVFSTDECTYDLIRNEQGEFYNEFARRVNGYLRKIAAETALAGANVILDWGFWTWAERKEMSEYFASRGVPFEWHYVEADADTWAANIAGRNRRISEGRGGSDFYVDEGLLDKLDRLFEAPLPEETDVWVRTDRTRPLPEETGNE